MPSAKDKVKVTDAVEIGEPKVFFCATCGGEAITGEAYAVAGAPVCRGHLGHAAARALRDEASVVIERLYAGEPDGEA